jgi:hypothetical protein
MLLLDCVAEQDATIAPAIVTARTELKTLRRERADDGISELSPDAPWHRLKRRRLTPRAFFRARTSPCAQKLIMTVLIDWGVKPAGLWRKGGECGRNCFQLLSNPLRWSIRAPSGGHSGEITMAQVSTQGEAQKLILQAIKQKDPEIKPGDTFDWLIVSNKLRHDLSKEEFSAAMAALGAAGMIGADPDKRAFTVTEKGLEALQ